MIKTKVVANPREENGDLGKLKCNVCGARSGAYVNIFRDKVIEEIPDYRVFKKQKIQIPEGMVCKGCLIRMVNSIDDTILGRCQGD